MSSAAAPGADPDQSQQDQRLCILLVEDDEADYIYIRDLLQQVYGEKLNLGWVDGIDVAKRALESDTIDLCLLDHKLGAQNGLDILRYAKKRRSPLPIVILSGQRRYDVDLEAMNLGAAGYLDKNEITVTNLERAIRYALRGRRKSEPLAPVRKPTASSLQTIPTEGTLLGNRFLCSGADRKRRHGMRLPRRAAGSATPRGC